MAGDRGRHRVRNTLVAVVSLVALLTASACTAYSALPASLATPTATPASPHEATLRFLQRAWPDYRRLQQVEANLYRDLDAAQVREESSAASVKFVELMDPILADLDQALPPPSPSAQQLQTELTTAMRTYHEAVSKLSWAVFTGDEGTQVRPLFYAEQSIRDMEVARKQIAAAGAAAIQGLRAEGYVLDEPTDVWK